jgi:hypothetical protein
MRLWHAQCTNPPFTASALFGVADALDIRTVAGVQLLGAINRLALRIENLAGALPSSPTPMP